jgi:hypothetical protein
MLASEGCKMVRAYLNDDRSLALLQTHSVSSSNGVVRGTLVADDLQQRHLVHW